MTRSRLKLFWSLAIFTLLYSPWDPFKLCWKKIKLFFYKISFTFLYVYLLISCTGLKTNTPTSLLDFILRRVGVGELNRRRNYLTVIRCVRVPLGLQLGSFFYSNHRKKSYGSVSLKRGGKIELRVCVTFTFSGNVSYQIVAILSSFRNGNVKLYFRHI